MSRGPVFVTGSVPSKPRPETGSTRGIAADDGQSHVSRRTPRSFDRPDAAMGFQEETAHAADDPLDRHDTHEMIRLHGVVECHGVAPDQQVPQLTGPEFTGRNSGRQLGRY